MRSTKISCQAIGLLGRVMDLPPNWNFTKAGIIAICADGETAVESALAEPEKWGYLRKTMQMPNESPNGRIHYVYDFYEYSALDTSLPEYNYVLETFTVDNATLNRVKKDSNFTMISNKLLRNKNIKNKFLGFLLKVLSLPNYWNFTMSGLVSICKEGKTAVRNAVGKLMEMGYLVRTKLLPNESIHNSFEYVYEFFEKPLSTDEAKEREAETRRKAITVRKNKRSENSNSTAEKQEVENLYLDSQPAESLPTENQGQYNTKKKIQNNQVFTDKSSIISPAPQKKVFNNSTVENVEKKKEEYNTEERKLYAEVVMDNIDYYELGDWLCVDDRDGYKEADEIVSFIVDEICSSQPYGTIRGQSFPRSVIRSQMLKANLDIVQRVIINMSEVDGVRDFRRYFINSLYNETLTHYFNEGCASRWADYAVARDFGY